MEARSFFATVVYPGKPCSVTVPPGAEFSLANVALRMADGDATDGRVVLYCSVNDAPPIALVPFIMGSVESATIDLHFTNSDRIVFTTQGVAVSIDVCGFVMGAFALEVSNGAPQ